MWKARKRGSEGPYQSVRPNSTRLQRRPGSVAGLDPLVLQHFGFLYGLNRYDSLTSGAAGEACRENMQTHTWVAALVQSLLYYSYSVPRYVLHLQVLYPA